MKVNKKGFTLVEVLAAVTILGILSVVAITSVNKIIQNAKESHYTTAESEMKLAGQSYVQQNRSALPKAIGQKTKISLKTLVDKNYIKAVRDYSDNECDLDKSYVQIFKYSKDDYSYLAYLDCPSYDSKEEMQKSSPTITIVMDPANITNSATAKITVSDPEKLISWSYIIYQDGKEVKNSGSISLPNYDKTVTKTVKLSDYTPGSIKVVVSATNIYGITTTKTSDTINYQDSDGPTCLIDEADQEPKVWTKDPVTITVGCKDENGVGCTREQYSKTFTEATEKGTIAIEDKAGHKTNCTVTVYIDDVKPTITVKAYKRTASGGKTGSALATITANDTNSDVTLDLSSVSTTKWLNNTYANGIYYEVTYSDSTSPITYEAKANNAGLTSTASNVNTLTSIDQGSATSKTKTTHYETTDDGHRIYQLEVTDAAGNKSSVKIITPLDRQAPTVPTVNMYTWVNNDTRPTSTAGLASYTNNTWSKLKVYTTASGITETLSGFDKYQYTTTGATTNETTNNSYRSVEADGISYIKYRACDKAGNCSAYSADKTIKIDKIVPTCDVTGGNTAWINASSTTTKRTVTATCTDTGGSGCKVSSFSYDYSSNINTTTAGAAGNGVGGKVSDNAGNTVACPANQTVKIDKNVPTISSITNPSNGNPAAPGLVLTLNGADTGGSGIAKWRYTYNTANGWTDYASSNKSPFTTTAFTTKRNQDVYISICDSAGNCSQASSTKIHIVDVCAADYKVVDSSESWSTCSKKCGGGTQTRTVTYKSSVDGSSCGSKEETQNCNAQACCAAGSITYVETTSCSASCDGGNYKREAYSTYDNSIRCSSFDDWSGGSCNTQGCCSSTYTSWGDWSSCSVDCGGGTQTRTGTKYSNYDGRDCGSDSESQACNQGACVNYCNDASWICTSTWVNANDSWGNWCHASGTVCCASGGYVRQCSSSWCSGMTAKEVNNKWGCDYANYCCTCS